MRIFFLLLLLLLSSNGYGAEKYKIYSGPYKVFKTTLTEVSRITTIDGFGDVSEVDPVVVYHHTPGASIICKRFGKIFKCGNSGEETEEEEFSTKAEMAEHLRTLHCGQVSGLTRKVIGARTCITSLETNVTAQTEFIRACYDGPDVPQMGRCEDFACDTNESTESQPQYASPIQIEISGARCHY